MLASLHDRTSDEFVLAAGFGPTRMAGIHAAHARGIELPDEAPVPLPPEPESTYDPNSESPMPLADATLSEQIRPAEDALMSMHESGLRDFLNPDRIGYVKDRDHVAGFMSHRFTKIPDLTAPKDKPATWQIVRLELVGLLRHETPVAYVSKNLPQMNELRDAPTRPLGEF
jgi:hypothetical protein